MGMLGQSQQRETSRRCPMQQARWAVQAHSASKQLLGMCPQMHILRASVDLLQQEPWEWSPGCCAFSHLPNDSVVSISQLDHTVSGFLVFIFPVLFF